MLRKQDEGGCREFIAATVFGGCVKRKKKKKKSIRNDRENLSGAKMGDTGSADTVRFCLGDVQGSIERVVPAAGVSRLAWRVFPA